MEGIGVALSAAVVGCSADADGAAAMDAIAVMKAAIGAPAFVQRIRQTVVPAAVFGI